MSVVPGGLRLATVLLACAALGACTNLDGAFVCETDSQCVSNAGPGHCEPTHVCSFADPSCPSGQRYGSLDGTGLARLCTDSVDLGGDDFSVQIDGASSMNVAHLAGPQSGGTGALSFAAAATDLLALSSIDTTALQIDAQAPPAGVIFETGHEATSGAELAVLRVGTLTIEAATTVRVVGDRGLVIVASGDVTIAGVLDGGAKLDVPGPGGAASSAGLGAGVASVGDYGSSGAGYGTGGGAGNAGKDGQGTDLGPSSGGASYGDAPVTVLFGGSGGGAGSATNGGAGGGIIQVTSATSISVDMPGGIDVGGGGVPAGPGAYFKSASGGGSGGTIFLQAPRVTVSGSLTANGGGGGGTNHELAAQDGQRSTAPAQGGKGDQNSGGSGGAKSVAPTEGKFCQCSDGNYAGGGGGAVGRISVLAHSYGPFGVVSPTESWSKN